VISGDYIIGVNYLDLRSEGKWHANSICIDLLFEDAFVHGLYFSQPLCLMAETSPLHPPIFLLRNPSTSWLSSRPCTRPLSDYMPLLDRRIGDFDPWIRGGGHGLFSPLGHGVGGRSRRSRRVTTLPLHNAWQPLSLVTASPRLGASSRFPQTCGIQEFKGRFHTAMYRSGPLSPWWALGACAEERARFLLAAPG
jgi:hypothetical protein